MAIGLTTPPTVQKLQAALHAKAKQAPSFRFYALYDKICQADVLQHAYNRSRANGGSTAGADGLTFAMIEAPSRKTTTANRYSPQLVPPPVLDSTHTHTGSLY